MTENGTASVLPAAVVKTTGNEFSLSICARIFVICYSLLVVYKLYFTRNDLTTPEYTFPSVGTIYLKFMNLQHETYTHCRDVVHSLSYSC